MKNILMIGQFTDISGYGNAARNYLETLVELDKEKKISLKIINFSFETNSSFEINNEMYKYSLTNDFNILRGGYNSDDLEKINYYINNTNYSLILFLTNDWINFGHAETNILVLSGQQQKTLNINLISKKAENLYPCVVWETDGVPPVFSEAYKNILPKKLICACKWNEEVFSKNTNLECATIPYFVDTNKKINNEFKQKLLEIKKDRVAFCSVSQWSNRKGFDKLIKSFLLEFYDNENVCLIIKTYLNKNFYNIDEKNFFIQEIQKIKDSITYYGKKVDFKCKIIILNDILDEDQINAIYDVSDFYITATRGEGFGLPIAEFLTFRKPVCVPDKGGHLDFIHEDNFYIKSSFEPCDGLNSFFYSAIGMNYIECSINSIKNNLRACYNLKINDKEKYIKIGQDSFDFLSFYLSKQNIKNKFIETLGV